MKVYENYCLKNNNTFKISVNASKYVEYSSNDEFVNFVNENHDVFKGNFLIVGEGSNLLFTKDYQGMIIHPKTNSIKIVSKDDSYIYVEADAGYDWDEFVEWTIQQNAFGLENLSLIPGTVGASVVQNVGAYGAEAGNFAHLVTYIDLNDFTVKTLSNNQCKFDYRNSIFKNKLIGKAIVLKVVYRLLKEESCNTNYTDIQNYLNGSKEVNPRIIREAVIDIRNKKLPDPDLVGNAGSFFKNPIINAEEFAKVSEKHPEIRYYTLADGTYKLAAGWLIDNCKLKGFEHKGAAVHENQALVLINKSGEARGSDVLDLSKIIQEKVFDVYGVKLEPEVIIL